MKAEKTANNVEFDVIYDDGTRKRVKDGLLFEKDTDGEIIMHVGTSKFAVFFATAEALLLLFEKLGMTETFEKYLSAQLDDDDEDSQND